MYRTAKTSVLVAVPLSVLLASGLTFAHGDKHKATSSEPVDKTQQA